MTCTSELDTSTLRTRTTFESFSETRRISLSPSAEADIQLLRHAEYQLASAIGAASSRLVLSLLLRKRTVSTQAALKTAQDLLDQVLASVPIPHQRVRA